VLPFFAGRDLPFDLVCTQTYAVLVAISPAAGLAIATADGFVPAIAAANDFAVATRDTHGCNNAPTENFFNRPQRPCGADLHQCAGQRLVADQLAQRGRRNRAGGGRLRSNNLSAVLAAARNGWTLRAMPRYVAVGSRVSW